MLFSLHELIDYGIETYDLSRHRICQWRRSVWYGILAHLFPMLSFELVNTDLTDHLVAHGRMTEREARPLIMQLLSALHFCHSHHIV